MVNQLTREGATSLLHLLHHLSTGTYFKELDPRLYNKVPGEPGVGYDHDTTGTLLSPAILDALHHARGGQRNRGLDLYAIIDGTIETGPSVFGDVNVRIHFREPINP